MREGKKRIFAEITRLVRSDESFAVLDSMVDLLFKDLQEKKIGRLARFIPSGIKDGLVDYLQKATSAMLANEVPGLVHSLNINKIVTEKINSLDLLRLERLLLSIMEEQFKYINLFGALLGFLIGCLNLFFVH
jgi:uncharacterized membrane protein YheB (UPF0754 family)